MANDRHAAIAYAPAAIVPGIEMRASAARPALASTSNAPAPATASEICAPRTGSGGKFDSAISATPTTSSHAPSVARELDRAVTRVDDTRRRIEHCGQIDQNRRIVLHR